MNDPNQHLPIPPLVVRAKEHARQFGFEQSCLDSFGRFLMTMACAARGPILELGTGLGVGTAWLASQSSQPIFSFETNESVAAAAKAVFADHPEVLITVGDFNTADKSLEFALAFIDVADQKDDGQPVINAMKSGGMIVLDDFTPEWLKPNDWKGQRDSRREFWLNHPQLSSVEILTTTTTAAIVASKIHAAPAQK